MKVKSEKGSITLYVLIAMLIFTSMAIGTFVLSANRQQTQAESIEKLKSIYANGKTQEELYENYIGGDIIPIYTEEQLNKIGSNEEISINGKTYIFSTGKTYVLQNDIECEGNVSDVLNLVENGSAALEKNGNKLGIKPLVTLKNGNLITLTDENASTYYGKKVTNYTAGNATWRIFYVDIAGKYGEKDTIYLKADYDDSRKMALSQTYSRTDVLSKINSLWWEQRSVSRNSWNENEKATAWLCDPENWTTYCDTTKANWAIGGPSVEMYMDSYNKTHGANSLNYAYSESDYPGYKVGTGGSATEYKTPFNGINTANNGIYMSSGSWIWLASPVSSSTYSVYGVSGPSTCLYAENYDGSTGKPVVCPLVSLKIGFVPQIDG